jgi:hypothetical protein
MCVLGIIMFILYLNNPNLRFSTTSAKTATTEQLPQTANPNVKMSSPKDAEEMTKDAEEMTKDAEETGEKKEKLPQTQNPRIPHEKQPKPAKNTHNLPAKTTSTMNFHAYTHAGMQARLDEHVFRPDTNLRQSYSSRERVLNGMYKELLETSVKNDPALRSKSGDSCEPIRGKSKPHIL